MILRRRESERFSEVIKEWIQQTAVLLGGGPSLTQEQVALVRRAREAGQARVIAVNDAYLWAPWSDVLYAGDAHWHVWHSQGTPKPHIGLTAAEVRERFAAFAGQKCSIESQAANIKDNGVHILRSTHRTSARNSGVEALELSVLAGATKVILLGFDGQPTSGKTHWSGGHPLPTPEDAYMHYRKSFSEAAAAIKKAGVLVINASPDSAIDCFPKMDIEQALCFGELK